MSQPQITPVRQSADAAPEALQARLGDCMSAHRRGLAERIARLLRGRAPADTQAAALASLLAAIAASEAERATRLARMPAVTYPEALPIAARRAEIAAAIARSQVTIVCGETGSGKTTQLPKICLELGRGAAGLIGHTQPRRIAARTVAQRIAQELGTSLGAVVGYKVRFQDKTQSSAYVKLMTDGILLAETQGDALLSSYDTLIIDEAHERSLNIDFLLGYLRGLLPQRPDLKLIITSATIDAERFSRHFGGAPVIEVSGRLYPVELRYRPLVQAAADARQRDDGPDEAALTQAVLAAVDEVRRLGPGHVLVFLPGEREIRETAQALRRHRLGAVEILPLYARLSAAEQERVFAPGSTQRIVLATNVAETSLTVPGVRYVIDTGLARVNRYSYRNKIEQLLTEKIARASADQRAGRCGRVMNGVCLRLYSEEDYHARPQFADPELLRSSLAAVILRMHALGLGEVEGFAFLDPPQPRMVRDGYQLLQELGAIDAQLRLTRVGRELARLPIDPRVGRMVLEARRHGCLSEVLVLAAALSVQDPRDRPFEQAQAADDRQAQFRDERSDFAGLLKLWRFYVELLDSGRSRGKLDHVLREHFLSPARMREWREVHTQLHALVAETGTHPNEAPASYEQVHRALLAGLLGNIGLRNEEGDYSGARGIRFALHPGCGPRKRPPRWVMAAELMETTRLYARTAAAIEPEWVEQAAAHLVRRAWLEPRWDRERAETVAWEQVSLYGLVLIARRRVSYGPIDPAHAREIFLRSGLVQGGYVSRAPFQAHNAALRRELEALEHKARRRDVLVDEESMYRFFAARVPADVAGGAQFEQWRVQAEQAEPRLLFMTRADLVRRGTEDITAELYPESLDLGEAKVRLRYRFDPGHPLDGVSARIPLHLLNRLRAERFEWLVPGLLRDKVNVLVRGLPKHLRRACVPLPETVTQCLQHMEGADPDQGLLRALGDALEATRGVRAPPELLREIALPEHLRMHFSVCDDDGGELAAGRDLAALRESHGARAQARFAPGAQWERSGIRVWTADLTLPERVEIKRGREVLSAYPALLDEGESVRLTVLDTAREATLATQAGICRLVRLALPEQMRGLARMLAPDKQLALSYHGCGDAAALADSLLRASVARAVWADPTPVRNQAEFEARLKQVRARLQLVGQEYLRLVTEILRLAQSVRKALERARAFKHAAADIAQQLAALIHPGFVTQVAYARLQQYPRYLQAIERRIAKLAERGERDQHHTRELQRWMRQVEARLAQDRKSGCDTSALEELRWMLEEQRVSLFAQELKTPYPVSYKRLEKAWAALG